MEEIRKQIKTMANNPKLFVLLVGFVFGSTLGLIIGIFGGILLK